MWVRKGHGVEAGGWASPAAPWKASPKSLVSLMFRFCLSLEDDNTNLAEFLQKLNQNMQTWQRVRACEDSLFAQKHEGDRKPGFTN